MTGSIAGLSRLAGAAVALTVAAQQVAAQDSAGCERAARAVTAKSLPPAGSADWNNYLSLTNCGSRGATVIAGALQSSAVRSENDPARLDALTGLLDGWFAPALVMAYESVASTPSATPALRARAMWLLAGLVTPGVEVAGPLQGYVASTCSAYDRGTILRDAPATLPQQAVDDARLTYARVASDMDSPEQLRSTARCWQDAVSGKVVAGTNQKSEQQTQQDRRQSEAPVQVVHDTQVVREVVYQPTTQITVIEPIEVEYECDGRFIVWNTGPSDLAVRYAFDGGLGGSLRLGGRGSHTFVASRFGPVSFYVGSRRVVYSNYSYRSCRDGYHHGYMYGGRYVISRPIYVPRYYSPRPVIVVNNPRPRPGVIVERPGPDVPRRAEPRGEAPRREEPRREQPRREEPRRERPRGNDGSRQTTPQAAPQAAPRAATPEKPAPSPRTAQPRIAISRPN